MMLEDYTLTSLLGKGTFGDVFLTTKKDSNLQYATKRMDRSLVDHPKYCKYFVNEVSILKNVYHKNIIKVVDLKKTKNNYYIIMDFCNGGSLKSNLDKYKTKYNKPFPEKVVQHIMRQIISAITYLHGLKIVHRDLKLDNILVNYSSEEDKKQINLLNAEVKLIDFGFATHISNVSLLTSAIGSPFNMDPRILKKYSSHEKCPQTYDEKADIWSLGCLCYQMLVGEFAFIANDIEELNSKIEKGNFKIPITFAKETISFLMNMLQYDPKKRSSAAEISQHPFLIKPFENFSYIDLRKVLNKINNEDLYLNIKNNQTICSVINNEGTKRLNISPNELIPLETATQYINQNNSINNNNAFDNNNKNIENSFGGFNGNNNMNLSNQKGYPSMNQGNNMNKQEIHNSAPISNNNSKTNKDPILNQLLNQASPKEKNLLNSLIFANENTAQLSKTSIQTGKFNQNSTYELSASNELGQKANTGIYPIGINKMNPFMNQQNQSMGIKQQFISPLKPGQNRGAVSDNKKTPNMQHKFDNPVNINQINRSVGTNRTISSQNLGNFTFNDFQDRFNTLPPRDFNEFSFGNNNQIEFQKMNSSDKQLNYMNNYNFYNNNSNNNTWIKKDIRGFEIQSSKNLNPKALNFNNIQ